MRTSRTAVVLSALFLSATVVGCATSGAVGRAASSADLTVDEAERVVVAYKNRHDLRAANPNPLKEPRSLDDVLEVLRLDEIDLFPGAVRFATQEGSPRGKALAAQILLAWGDAQHLLGNLLARSVQDLEEHRGRLERRQAAGKLDDGELARLDRIRKTLTDVEGVERALRRVGNRHIQEGMEMAEKVIASSPSDYEGYRVAADYYHQREDWGRFDEMMKKLEALNPQSNGLIFLRAEAARDRDQDRREASKLFKEAVERDPKFTRAQVGRLIVQPDINGAYAELQKLKQINPNHQVVVWMGPILERSWDEWREVNARRVQQTQDRATPAPVK